MIKEALQYIVGLSKDTVVTIGDSDYSTENLRRIDKELRAEPLYFSTLNGIVSYLKSNIDYFKDQIIVQVVSPTEVVVLSALDSDRKRERLIVSNAIIPEFKYGLFLNSEDFIISLQSKFVKNDDLSNVLSFAGTAESGTVASYSDDGISQKATVSTGIVSKESCIVPNPVALRPYRTFQEVEQPESLFIFRMKNTSDDISAALFEADGKSWRIEAMNNIKEYLGNELKDVPGILVLA